MLGFENLAVVFEDVQQGPDQPSTCKSLHPKFLNTPNPKTPVRSLVQVISQSAGDLGKGIEEVPRPEALFVFCPLIALGFWVSGLLNI